MCKLDPKSLHIRAYTDASFSNNPDHSSQLVYIVLLADKHNNACVLHYASCRSHKVARSVLGAETYAFAEAFNFACCAKRDLEMLLDRCVSLTILTDSKNFFDVITKCFKIQERCLRIDLQAVRDAYAVHDISNLGFIRVPSNSAVGLAKISKFHVFYRLLQTGKCDFISEQWVIRCPNAVSPTKYLTTVPLVYDRSCCSNNINTL